MRLFTSILLLLALLAAAIGMPQAIHAREHEQSACAAEDGVVVHPEQASPVHIQHTCVLCLQLHSPSTPPPARAWLIDTGAWVRYVSMLATSQRSQTFAGRLSCRGPPGQPSC